MSLYKIYQGMANRELSTYEQFYQMYKKAYLNKIYTISDLVHKLKKLEEVEEQWVHHRDYRSYKASVKALKQIIEDIKNNNLFTRSEEK